MPMYGEELSGSSSDSEEDKEKPDESDDDPDHNDMAFHLLDYALKAMKKKGGKGKQKGKPMMMHHGAPFPGKGKPFNNGPPPNSLPQPFKGGQNKGIASSPSRDVLL